MSEQFEPVTGVREIPGREERVHIKSGTQWARDLAAVRRREMTFDAFARRHRGIVRMTARPWAARVPEKCCREDLEQEVLIVVWQAIEGWDPDRGVPLDAYVRVQIHYKLLAVTDRLLRARPVETRFFSEQRDSGDDPLPLELAEDQRRRAAAVVGSLSARDAALLAEVIGGGKTLAVARTTVFSNRTPRGARKKACAAAREAVRIAAQIQGGIDG